MKKILYILTVLVMMTSCQSKKHLTKGDKDLKNQAEAVLSVEKGRFEETLKTAYDFSLLQSRAKYALGSKSLSGRLNIERGKRLCMTVTVLGIEVARVEVNQKNVVIVDKFDKLYTELSIEEFASQLGLKDEMRYEALECLLLGRMFVPGSGEASAKDFGKFDWTIHDKNMTGELTRSKYGLEYVIGEDNTLRQTIVKARHGEEHVSVACHYLEHQPLEGGKFATAQQLTLTKGDEDIKATLTLSAPIMGKTWTTFVPTAAYQKVTLAELVTAIKSMKN